MQFFVSFSSPAAFLVCRVPHLRPDRSMLQINGVEKFYKQCSFSAEKTPHKGFNFLQKDEISIPSDDPVRLVSAFVEEMDLSELYRTYARIRKNQATSRQMLKLVIYAAMNRIYSSRDIQKACKRDINFMYLLEGMPAPDHATIARFISLHFSACAKVLLAQMSDLLYLLGEISGKTIFIDGTKIESAANKYTFVWKRAITKNQTGCDLHENERRCDAEWTAKACL